MPELPEVETVVRDLRPHLPGRKIVRVELGRKQVLKTPPRKIVAGLEGAVIDSIERWGKNILIRASNGRPVWWLMHLGMSGRLAVARASEARRPHTHGVFALDSGEFELRFTDPRMFGRIEVWREMPPRLKVLGPEPLEIGVEEFTAAMKKRHTGLKALLLNQIFVRGMGNIYADESLFRAGLHPRMPASKVSAPRAADLHRAMQDVLKAAIESKGSSVRTFLYGQGESGAYQQDHLVYGRGGEPCTRCKSPIRTATIAGRTTAWCPQCQRKTSGKR